MDPNLSLVAPAAWTTSVLGAGGFLLYAVGGVLDHADLLVLVLGSIPITAFGRLAFGRPPLQPDHRKRARSG